jgi:hypothetical protein
LHAAARGERPANREIGPLNRPSLATLDEQRGSREELLWPDCRDREELYGMGGRGRPMKSLADRG